MWRVGTPSLAPPPVPRGCARSNPVSSDVNVLGEVAGCKACREERGFLPEGGAGPDVLFWECSKGFFFFVGWKRKCRLRSMVV